MNEEKSVIEKHVEQLREETKVLLGLLEKPEYGLVTWTIAVINQIDRIASFKVVR